MIQIPHHEQLALRSYILSLASGTVFTTQNAITTAIGTFTAVRHSPPALSINASYGKFCKNHPNVRQIGRCKTLDGLGHPTTTAILEKI